MLLDKLPPTSKVVAVVIPEDTYQEYATNRLRKPGWAEHADIDDMMQHYHDLQKFFVSEGIPVYDSFPAAYATFGSQIVAKEKEGGEAVTDE